MFEPTIGGLDTISGAAAILGNRYRVLRQLGQGGMGAVWLAEDTQLDNRRVAIKMLPTILVANKRAYNQLKAEALVSLKLTHPNIVAVRAFEENGGNPFLVVDYVEGQTLDDYLADSGALSEDETIRLLKPIALALDYAHGEGVVHRDVKPGNVMIRKDGHPFILDFGIAREIQETMTRVTGRLSSGTLTYMSPEQLHGAASNPSQDVYSFAAMAYECLTGAPPFSRGQIEYQIEHDAPAPLGRQFARCGSGIMAGLAKNPTARPANCAGVLSIAHAPPASTIDRRAPTFPGLRGLPVVVFALAALAIVCGTVHVWRQERMNAIASQKRVDAEKARQELENAIASQKRADAEKARQELENAIASQKRADAEKARQELEKKELEAKKAADAGNPASGKEVAQSRAGGHVLDVADSGIVHASEDEDGRGQPSAVETGDWQAGGEANDSEEAETAEEAPPLVAKQKDGERSKTAAVHHAGDVKTVVLPDGRTTLVLVWCPPGDFMMGADYGDSDASSDAKPRHRVKLTRGFWLGKTEVTHAQWKSVMAFDRSLKKASGELEKGNHPVRASWAKCRDFAANVNMRLPTEAEWEYACTCGGRVRNVSAKLDDVAWYWANARQKVHLVAKKDANGWGLHDMLGNAGEWCADWFGGYSRNDEVDPSGPSSGSERVLRGGHFNADARYCTPTWREGHDGDRHGDIYGFRVAMDDD